MLHFGHLLVRASTVLFLLDVAEGELEQRQQLLGGGGGGGGGGH